MRQCINFIGCGQLGKTLGKLWNQNGAIDIGTVLTRSQHSAKAAVDFIGEGTAIETITEMQSANFYLIACNDDDIATCSQALAASQLLRPGDIVFHCSGAQPSSLLEDCKRCGAHIASAHPIKSFANLSLAVDSFSGTYCGIEGDEIALAKLSELFTSVGAHLLHIQAEQKSLYHAASVMASNYLVTLQELSIQAFEQAGINRQDAMAVLHPIVTGTVDNIFRLGTVEALTGPISRGDHQVVASQLSAISGWDEDIAAVYRLLGKLSLPLAAQQQPENTVNLAPLLALLK